MKQERNKFKHDVNIFLGYNGSAVIFAVKFFPRTTAYREKQRETEPCALLIPQRFPPPLPLPARLVNIALIEHRDDSLQKLILPACFSARRVRTRGEDNTPVR